MLSFCFLYSKCCFCGVGLSLICIKFLRFWIVMDGLYFIIVLFFFSIIIDIVWLFFSEDILVYLGVVLGVVYFGNRFLRVVKYLRYFGLFVLMVWRYWEYLWNFLIWFVMYCRDMNLLVIMIFDFWVDW